MAHCLTYYAHKDMYGFPIPNTMQGYPTNKVECNNSCSKFKLLSTTPTPGVGEAQYHHPNHFRFWVRKDCEGKLIPNSLFSTQGIHPGGNVVEQIRIICCECPPSLYLDPNYICNYVH